MKNNEKKKRVSLLLYKVYQTKPETRRTGLASLAIPTLFLVSPDKLNIKRHQYAVLFKHCTCSEHQIYQSIYILTMFITEFVVVVVVCGFTAL